MMEAGTYHGSKLGVAPHQGWRWIILPDARDAVKTKEVGKRELSLGVDLSRRSDVEHTSPA